MTTKINRPKLKIYRKSLALNLMVKYKVYELKAQQNQLAKSYKYTLKPAKFLQFYSPLLTIFHIYYTMDFWRGKTLMQPNSLKMLLSYYSRLTQYNLQHNGVIISRNYFNTFSINNMVIFSKPKRQLFLMLFWSKPTFVFTGGLMRLVMNEKRKSSKRMLKVATSLIKLVTLLLLKKNFLTSFYLRLKNVGNLRLKIIRIFLSQPNQSNLKYIIVQFRRNIGSQKFATRRAIKKYIKKRFKTN